MKPRALVACILALALFIAACNPAREAGRPVRGGTFRIAAPSEIDSIDPGQAYGQDSFMLMRILVRPLLTYRPGRPNELVGDAARDTGAISADGLTYSYRLREGIRYQPQMAGGRAIRSEDIRYAIERGFRSSVANPYVDLYFAGLEGAAEFKAGKAAHISGIDVGDPRAIVFHLLKPAGDFPYRLALPITAPVPEEYAASFDRRDRSTYGPNLASTGPYMLEHTGGKVTGFQSGKRVVAVRNPNWRTATDAIRSAAPDRFEMLLGFDDPSVATDKILRGEFDFGLFLPPADKIRSILADPARRKQLHLDLTGCFGYVSLNTRVAPFDDVRVRRATNVVMDKEALRLIGGGASSGEVATHVLPSGIVGFDEAGGKRYDPYGSPGSTGDVERARALMREAGHPSGMYRGAPVLAVVAQAGDRSRTMDVVEDSLAKIGIRLKREEYPPEVAYARYIGVPERKVGVTTDGYCWDYPDPVTIVPFLFDGRRIQPQGNANTSHVDDAGLNALIDRASAASGGERARLWAEVDHRVMDLAPVIPLLWPSSRVLVSKRVVGYRFFPSISTIDLASVSITATS
ncbi:MAG: ABC transporter substrate-binding protein [Actinomycetota bacterium]